MHSPKLPTLIHIDDNEDTRKAVKESLQDHFDNIISCESFTEFNARLLQMTAEARASINAIITDISIRDGDVERGMPIVTLIQRTLSTARMNTPFFVYSGSGGSPTIQLILKSMPNSSSDWAIEKRKEGEVPDNFAHTILTLIKEAKMKKSILTQYKQA